MSRLPNELRRLAFFNEHLVSFLQCAQLAARILVHRSQLEEAFMVGSFRVDLLVSLVRVDLQVDKKQCGIVETAQQAFRGLLNERLLDGVREGASHRLWDQPGALPVGPHPVL